MSDDSKAEALTALRLASVYERQAMVRDRMGFADIAAEDRSLARGQRLLAAVLNPGDDAIERVAIALCDDPTAYYEELGDDDREEWRAVALRALAALRTIAAAAPATPEPPKKEGPPEDVPRHYRPRGIPTADGGIRAESTSEKFFRERDERTPSASEKGDTRGTDPD